MTAYQIEKILIYFSTDDGEKHFVPNRRSLKYLALRKNTPKWTYIFDTKNEVEKAVQAYLDEHEEEESYG